MSGRVEDGAIPPLCVLNRPSRSLSQLGGLPHGNSGCADQARDPHPALASAAGGGDVNPEPLPELA